MFSAPQTAPLGSCFERSSGPGKPTEKVLRYQTLRRWSKTKGWKCYWLQQLHYQPLAADLPAAAFLQRHSCVSHSFIKGELKKIAAAVPSCCEPRDPPLSSATLLFHKVFRTHLRLKREKHLFYHFSLSFSDWQKVPLFSICKTLRKSNDHKANQIHNESRKNPLPEHQINKNWFQELIQHEYLNK